jgi:DNA-binding transcriptional LysR family regulator
MTSGGSALDQTTLLSSPTTIGCRHSLDRVDLEAVRTFVAVADTGQFQEAAAALSITQQGVSRRIAALERDLGVRLFTRTARGAELTIDGQAFLPHARELLRVAERADASVRPGHRALRVDVVNRRVVTAVFLQDFYRLRPDLDLDVVTLDADAGGAMSAVASGEIDATFHAVPPHLPVPPEVRTSPLIGEPHELLVGPRHPLASARSVQPGGLRGYRIWMPGLAARGEVADYYDEFAAAFGLSIDVLGPVFGNETLLAELADSSDLATLVGERSRYLWPDSYDLRRIPIRNPSPVYPMAMIWHAANPHPGLAELRRYLESRRPVAADADIWTPKWITAVGAPTRTTRRPRRPGTPNSG